MIRYLLFLLCLPLVMSGATLEESLQGHIVLRPDGSNTIGHIAIDQKEKQISEATWIYVREALEEYQESRPDFIILELNTPGGQVFAAQKISDALKEIDTQYDIPVVAFINNWAISAGAMLAYSCRYISIVKDASMGAAQPIIQKGGQTETASEKVNSAIRTDFANRAAFFDRNPLIAEAMVDADLVLVERAGVVVELASDDEIQSSDTVITKKGKLLTLNAKEMIDLGVANILLEPAKLVPITATEEKVGRWPFSKELLATYPFFFQFNKSEVVAHQMGWKTKFFAFLASPIIASLLFLGLMLCFYLEINTPGFGVAGGMGIFFLFLIILSSFSVEAAGWLELILLGAGVSLILIELFVIPGFGITGILGIILVSVGLFAMLLPGIRDFSFDFDTNTFNAAGAYVLERLTYLAGALIIGTVIIALLARYLFPKLRLFSPLVLRKEEEGYHAGFEKENLPSIGTVGIVLAPLRLSGSVTINDEVLDAISNGRFIEKGEKVKVIAIEATRMVVEPLENP